MGKFIIFTTLTTAILILLQGCAAVVASSATTGAMVAQDRRTTGTIVEDKAIEFKARNTIREILLANEKSHVNVISYNNNVLILGQAPTEAISKNIEAAVGKVAKIKSVHNEIAIAAPSSMLTRSSDSWITTKVKSQMLVDKNINPTRVKVITEDGVVYLLGLINKDEEAAAVNVARHVKGVKKVVKMFEHLPS